MRRLVAAAFRRTDALRFDGDRAQSKQELLAVEEPLEIRLCGDPVATTMRTPGNDHELAIGFLLAEGVIARPDDVGAVVPCGAPGAAVVDVRPAPGVAFDWDPTEGSRLVSAACGVCGRASIDDLLARIRPLERTSESYSPSWLQGLCVRLRTQQWLFAKTGGVHAAGYFSTSGLVSVVREDVGRHNAVDKVVGRLGIDALLPPEAGALVVSGRVSFEIVQKALVAGIRLVLSVSAPTSLAVELARSSHLTLLSFAREQRFTCYSAQERLVASAHS